MEVVLSCFDVTLWSICLCQLVDHIGAMEVFRFMYNSHAGNAQIFLKLHEVVEGVAFVLMLVALLLDFWRLKLLLNHWRFFYQKESLFAN